MNRLEKQPQFDLASAIEQKPFERPSYVNFMRDYWFPANDSLVLEVVSRVDWEKRGTENILEKRPDGKKTLYVPKDLQLWEMIGIIEVIDHDTFADKPERKEEARKKLLELGKIFQNAGIYLAARLNSIQNGKNIAEALALEFYNYGQSLLSGKKSETPETIDDISSQELTPAEIDVVDRFLAGDSLYESRKRRADKKQEPLETERQKTLAQFFRASAKAFELSKPKEKSVGSKIKKWFAEKIEQVTGREEKEEREVEEKKSEAWLRYEQFIERKDLSPEERKEKKALEKIIFTYRPWESKVSVHSAFLFKNKRSMVQKIETPKRELAGSIFRRGVDVLEKNVPFDKLPEDIKELVLHWQNGEKTLREALSIDQLKTELAVARKTGDERKIEMEEQRIASKIQIAVSGFHFNSMSNNPKEMLATQYINCVGASMLGGALMQEVGLNYLLADVPEHSILFLVTTNGHVEKRDMLAPYLNRQLTDEVIAGINEGRRTITVADIFEFSKNPKPEGLMFGIKEGEQSVTVFKPEHGHIIQVLNNAGNSLGNTNEAVEAYLEAIANNPKFSALYFNLAKALSALGYKEKALDIYKRAIAINPEFATAYNSIGTALASLKRYPEAIEAFRKTIAVNPKIPNPYYNLANIFSILGDRAKSLKMCKKFVELADKEKDARRIADMKIAIAELSKK